VDPLDEPDGAMPILRASRLRKLMRLPLLMLRALLRSRKLQLLPGRSDRKDFPDDLHRRVLQNLADKHHDMTESTSVTSSPTTGLSRTRTANAAPRRHDAKAAGAENRMVKLDAAGV
jgi:hypothetical protein